MNPQQRGQLAGLAAAVRFGCSAPLISTVAGRGSALSIAALLYAGAAREAVIFSTAPFMRALVSLLVPGDGLTPRLAPAAGSMAAGVALPPPAPGGPARP